MAKDPTEVIRKAVLRMLPRNKLRDVSLLPAFACIHAFILLLAYQFCVFSYAKCRCAFFLACDISHLENDAIAIAIKKLLLF